VRSVVFRPLAESDLANLYRYIADRSGRAVANGYLDRLEAACEDLGVFPERGRARDDIWPRLRTMPFERRALIAYEVREAEVAIVRVLYAGRDLAQAFLHEAGET
jgi:toxin ParE1/3/4